jgi:hypothetical protein
VRPASISPSVVPATAETTTRTPCGSRCDAKRTARASRVALARNAKRPGLPAWEPGPRCSISTESALSSAQSQSSSKVLRGRIPGTLALSLQRARRNHHAQASFSPCSSLAHRLYEHKLPQSDSRVKGFLEWTLVCRGSRGLPVTISLGPKRRDRIDPGRSPARQERRPKAARPSRRATTP